LAKNICGTLIYAQKYICRALNNYILQSISPFDIQKKKLLKPIKTKASKFPGNVSKS
jgi:hypothetical protein